MIVLHVITKSTAQAHAIAYELFKRNFIANAQILDNILFLDEKENEISKSTTFVLVAFAKAVYCSDIASLIKELFPEQEPLYYAFPIINTNITLEIKNKKTIE